MFNQKFIWYSFLKLNRIAKCMRPYKIKYCSIVLLLSNTIYKYMFYTLSYDHQIQVLLCRTCCFIQGCKTGPIKILTIVMGKITMVKKISGANTLYIS